MKYIISIGSLWLLLFGSVQGQSFSAPGSESRPAPDPNLGIHESRDLGMARLFPNPAIKNITIEGFVVNVQNAYEILDATGRVVLSGKTEQASVVLDVSGLLPGSYFVRMYNEAGQARMLRLIRQ